MVCMTYFFNNTGNSTSTVNLPQCSYCGGIHTSACPRIEEIEYFETGGVKRVKLREASVMQTETTFAPVESEAPKPKKPLAERLWGRGIPLSQVKDA